MRLLVLAALAAWTFGASPVRAQDPKTNLFDTISTFRTAQESNITPDLLQEALAVVLRQQLAEGAVVDVEPEAPDVAVEARKSFARIMAAFAGRRRSGVNRYVSADYRVDPSVLDDDMAQMFRDNPVIQVNADILDVNVVDDMALVHFRYALRLVSNRGTESTFRGDTRMRFVLEDGRAMLVQQDAPQLIGTALPNSAHPRAVSQGPSPDKGSSGPQCPTPLTGTITMRDDADAFTFSTARVTTPPPHTNADFFRMGGAAVLRSNKGGVRFKSLGFGGLSDVNIVQTGGFSPVIATAVGERIAIRTAENKIAVIRIDSVGIDGGGFGIMTFSYMFQTTARVLCFP